MAGKRSVDYTGLEVKGWLVGEYLGKNTYSCRCTKCGYERGLLGYYIKDEKVPECRECRNKVRDISDTYVGEWHVLKKVSEGRQAKYLCECSCGEKRDVLEQSLLNGKSTGCGHNTNKQFIDMKGQLVGDWKVGGYNSETAKWKCKCKCGTERELTGYQLRNKLSLSCGHSTTGLKDLTNETFGEWTVLARSSLSNGVRTMWVCVCSCGTIKDIDGYALTSGSTNSCGCKTEELRRATSLKRYGVTHPAKLKTTIKRTDEQLKMVDTKEDLITAIKSNFKEKPSIYELSVLLGLSRGSTKSTLTKYGAEDYVVYGTQNISGYERMLNSLFPCDNISDRELLDGKELDLYYKDKKFAIEFNGNYWHSELKKHPKYHQEKALACREKGVQLFSIFEYEWNNSKKREQIKNILSSRLYGDRVEVIYARKCNVKDIDSKLSEDFIEEYHLQGKAKAAINIGMYSNNTGELVGVMTFGVPRYDRTYEYEIVRLAWKSGVVVVGGAEKMFKHFITKYKPSSIISYCDITKFKGTVYERLGFKMNGITNPNYKWVNVETNEAISRYKTQKQSLVSKGLGTDEETEVQIMTRLGYLRVFDCGNIRYTWEEEED